MNAVYQAHPTCPAVVHRHVAVAVAVHAHDNVNDDDTTTTTSIAYLSSIGASHRCSDAPAPAPARAGEGAAQRCQPRGIERALLHRAGGFPEVREACRADADGRHGWREC